MPQTSRENYRPHGLGFKHQPTPSPASRPFVCRPVQPARQPVCRTGTTVADIPFSLSNDLQLPACPSGLFIPPEARILEYKSRRLQIGSPRDPSHSQGADHSHLQPRGLAYTPTPKECGKPQMVRLHNLTEPQRPLAMPFTLQCLAAADVCAENTKVGIGGWVITPTAVTWFAEMWDISELRKPWSFLTKPAQSYIASFETLAQFALLQSTYHVSSHSYLQIQVPTGTDNTATFTHIVQS